MAENSHKGHRKRMREDFSKTGFCHWQRHKVLEYLLFYAIPVADTNETAHNLIRNCGGFLNVFRATKSELMQTNGVGEKTADFILALGEFIRYYDNESCNLDVFTLNSETSEKYLKNLFKDKTRECLYMISLDARNRIVGLDLLFEGNFESVELNIPSVSKKATKNNAAKVVFVHNHPTGILSPSDSDLRTTNILKHTLYLVGIELLDHIIVADDMCLSVFNFLDKK